MCSVDIVHSHGHVSLRDVQDGVSVQNRHGNIEVVARHPVTHPYTLHANNAQITFLIPQDAALDISARTGHGHIQTDLPLNVVKKGQMVYAEGQLDGGWLPCEMTNRRGNIHVETTGA